MRIGIDATCWWNRRGFGRFTRQLITAILADSRGHEIHLFVDREPAPEMVRPGVHVVRVETSATVTSAAVAEGRRKLPDMLRLRRAVAATPLDVIYFPAVYSWFPTPARTPTIITFHDAIAEHYASLVFPDRLGRFFWNLKTWLARRTAAGFTTVSEAAREEIVRYLKIPRDRIEVVLEAADPIFARVSDAARLAEMRSRLALPSDHRLLLYVGGLAPHKNLLRLARAFAKAAADPVLDDLSLVFVGDPEGGGFHSNYQELKALVDGDGRLAGRVHFTGFVSDDDLVSLYSAAHVVAMPALSEGFGLPAAEAIACGTPVIATGGGAVAEVVGEAGV
ncbi:MAG: glycosyltransferase family 4 protein, partial [Brevundimonas sp.]